MLKKLDRSSLIQHLEAKVKRQKKEALHRELLDEDNSDQDDRDHYSSSLLKTLKN
jgi:hypothetical protein